MKQNFVVQIYCPLSVKYVCVVCVCVCVRVCDCYTYLSLYLKFDATPPIFIQRRNRNRKFSQKCSKLVHNVTYVRFLVTCDYSEKNSMIKFHME